MIQTIIMVLCIAIWSIWYFYITRPGGDPDSNILSRWHRGYRRIVFFCGDIRLISHFPYITWDVHEHLVEYEEAVNALPLLRKGDIGLHRDIGYLSNLAIPGFMKHAWIHINDPDVCACGKTETTDMHIVEAVSEGVLRRHALYPIRSDYVIILRPKDVTKDEINRAIHNAQKIIGCRYDASFNFDIEDELKLLGTRGPGEMKYYLEDRNELTHLRNSVKAEWDGGFSCTETVSFAWWHKRRQLRLFRTEARGKKVILADQLINDGFKIVWMSKSITEQIIQKHNLGEEALEMITEYRKTHPV